MSALLDTAMICLTSHQMLVFTISPHVRCVFLDLAALKTRKLRFIAYFDREPSAEEKELIDDAVSETAMYYPELITHYKADCRYSEKPFDDLEKTDYYLFVRSDERGLGIDSQDNPSESRREAAKDASPDERGWKRNLFSS